MVSAPVTRYFDGASAVLTAHGFSACYGTTGKGSVSSMRAKLYAYVARTALAVYQIPFVDDHRHKHDKPK